MFQLDLVSSASGTVLLKSTITNINNQLTDWAELYPDFPNYFFIPLDVKI